MLLNKPCLRLRTYPKRKVSISVFLTFVEFSRILFWNLFMLSFPAHAVQEKKTTMTNGYSTRRTKHTSCRLSCDEMPYFGYAGESFGLARRLQAVQNKTSRIIQFCMESNDYLSLRMGRWYILYHAPALFVSMGNAVWICPLNWVWHSKSACCINPSPILFCMITQIKPETLPRYLIKVGMDIMAILIEIATRLRSRCLKGRQPVSGRKT